MGGGSDFLVGAGLGIAKSFSNEYAAQNEEARDIRAEQRKIQAQEMAEQRALANNKTLTTWTDDEKKRRKDEERVEELGRIEDGTDPALARTTKQNKRNARIETRKKKKQKKLGILGTQREITVKGLTSAEARASFNEKLEDLTGTRESDAMSKKDEAVIVLRELARPLEERTDSPHLYHVLAGGEGIQQASEEAKAEMAAMREEFREELLWYVGRSERSQLGTEARNSAVNDARAAALAEEVVEKTDAGMSHVKESLEGIMGNSQDIVQNAVRRHGSVAEAKKELYNALQEDLYKSMGYEIEDKRATGALRLWEAYRSELDTMWNGG